MKNKILKIAKWVGIVLVLILIVLFFLGLYGQRIENYLMLKSQEKFLAKVEKQKAEILEMQKNDTFGGATPEETLDLYIEALKAGDIELASNYWEVSLKEGDLRVKELQVLKNILNRDKNLNIILKNLENILNSKFRGFLDEKEYVITYIYKTEKNATSTMNYGGTEYSWLVPEGTEEEISIAFRLNPYTNVWKIIQ